jgi:hypothetical protein
MKNTQKASAECKPIPRSTCAKCGGRRSTSAPSLQARRRNAALKLRDRALRISPLERDSYDLGYQVEALADVVADLAHLVARIAGKGRCADGEEPGEEGGRRPKVEPPAAKKRAAKPGPRRRVLTPGKLKTARMARAGGA